MNSKIYVVGNVPKAFAIQSKRNGKYSNGEVLVEIRSGVNFHWLGAKRCKRPPKRCVCRFTVVRKWDGSVIPSGLTFHVIK